MKKDTTIWIGLLLVAILSTIISGKVMMIIMDVLVNLNVVAWAAAVILVITFIGVFMLTFICLILVVEDLYESIVNMSNAK